MKPAFRCSDYIEAHLVSGLLQQRGIDTFVQGAMLQGALGEVPALGHLAVLVADDDLSAARAIIEAYERGELRIDEHEDGIAPND